MIDAVKKLLENVNALEKKYGTKVKIIAATKTVPPERINLLPQLGIDTAGENRVQEFLSKHNEVKGLDWHFIGTLQTNKVKYLVGKVSLIQSVSRAELCDEIQRYAQKLNIVQDILIEVNISAESSKTGAGAQELENLLNYAASKPNLNICGLMCIPQAGAKKIVYQSMHGLYKKYQEQYNFKYLSMGMSDDYQTAIENGANMIRIGSLIFGKRI